MSFRKYAIAAFISLFAHSSGVYALIDMDDMSQDYVLESKQIHIPGYPDAFNASIVRWNGSLLLSFRWLPDKKEVFHSKLGVIWLDENFDPISTPQLLDTQHEDPFPVCLVPSRAEDIRFVIVGERLYIVYSDNKDAVLSGKGFRVYIAELTYDGQSFKVINNECLSDYPEIDPLRREKNWVPFNYKGDLMLAYSLQPHFVFKSLVGTGKCKYVSKTFGDIDWKWGELRGSTAAERLGDEYFSIFHSVTRMESVQSKGKNVPHYFMGAYTFSSKPPFEIRRISAEPIIGTGFYTTKEYKPYWGSIRAIFPCGYILDENYLWITYGKQDHEIWITKLDKNALLQSLIPVTTTTIKSQIPH